MFVVGAVVSVFWTGAATSVVASVAATAFCASASALASAFAAWAALLVCLPVVAAATTGVACAVCATVVLVATGMNVGIWLSPLPFPPWLSSSLPLGVRSETLLSLAALATSTFLLISSRIVFLSARSLFAVSSSPLRASSTKRSMLFFSDTPGIVLSRSAILSSRSSTLAWAFSTSERASSASSMSWLYAASSAA